MLTRKQHELLMFIHERIKETGVSPSFDEIASSQKLQAWQKYQRADAMAIAR